MKKYYFIPFFIATVLATIFFTKQCSVPEPKNKPLETTKFDLKEDSLKSVLRQREKREAVLLQKLDSIKESQITNVAKVENDVQVIKKMPTIGLLRFHDSLMVANGLR